MDYWYTVTNYDSWGYSLTTKHNGWLEAERAYQECELRLIPGEAVELCMVKRIYSSGPPSVDPPMPAPAQARSAA